MRAKLFATIALIGIGAAGYTLLPYTPVPGYFNDFTSRVSSLAGFGAENIRDRVLPDLEAELSNADLAIGAPVFVRVFNADRDVEIWLKANNRYRMFTRYNFCDADAITRASDANSSTTDAATATVGNAAELGVYHVTRDDLSPSSPHHLEIALTPLTSGSPEEMAEQAQTARPALRGNCEGTGGIALENSDIEPVYMLIDTALRAGQAQVPVHVFEKRQNMDDAVTLTEDAFASVPAPGLYDVYAAFERTRIPPEVHKTDGRYQVN
ncbi:MULTISPECIES: hypothetical protein [Thalassospira]|uniref:hypothetical protein n=1 Tax=Thalassospira TaxID=168934 RepID=UPI0007A5992C|nr:MULTISPECIES: hypothetical protein [Thalassospira]MBL4842725.1 hypothetical protein [Thalassospira sp.]MBR9782243.1 hypothetical protein [Rhodospirillales bacterium]MBR9815064.1 hypothetical protein [Rhodospirillales bacterium]MCD1594027.1 hypothetical protein [Thalassospira xiamenensis]OCK07931.1 hypothetical protein KO164_2109 [Thalassospira sp. KO164]